MKFLLLPKTKKKFKFSLISSWYQPDQYLGAHKLDEDNIFTQNREIRLALGAKKKWIFIDGKMARPPSDSDDLQKWLRNDMF